MQATSFTMIEKREHKKRGLGWGFLRYKSTKVHIIMVRYAGIEAGGTTWVVAIAEGNPTNVVSF